MRRKIELEEVTCDICHKVKPCLQVDYPVVFLTDQTEGRPCKPYIATQSLDICPECATGSLSITALGAQGHNCYKPQIILKSEFEGILERQSN